MYNNDSLSLKPPLPFAVVDSRLGRQSARVLRYVPTLHTLAEHIFFSIPLSTFHCTISLNLFHSLSRSVTRSVWSSRFQPRNDDRKQQYCVEFASWVVNRSTLPTDLTAAAKTDFCFLLFWSTHAFAWLQFRVRCRSHGKRRPWERASRISNKPIVCRRRSVGVF